MKFSDLFLDVTIRIFLSLIVNFIIFFKIHHFKHFIEFGIWKNYSKIFFNFERRKYEIASIVAYK